MEFATFISTAHDGLDGNDLRVFAAFIAAGVEDVIVDLRYNGGGLVARPTCWVITWAALRQ